MYKVCRHGFVITNILLCYYTRKSKSHFINHQFLFAYNQKKRELVMGNANNVLIVFLSLTSICTNSLHDHDDGFPHNNLFQQELGYDFRGYPSYIGPVEHTYKFDNSVRIEPLFSDQRRVDVSAKTVNVLSFGAKGDGKSDDTKVSNCTKFNLSCD